jgi:tripartite motif-containing protein 37
MFGTQHKNHEFQRLDQVYNHHAQLISTEVEKVQARLRQLRDLEDNIEVNIQHVKSAKEQRAAELQSALQEMDARLTATLKTKLLTLLGQKNDIVKEMHLLDSLLLELKTQLDPSVCARALLIKKTPELRQMLSEVHSQPVSHLFRERVSADFPSELIPEYCSAEFRIGPDFARIQAEREVVYSTPLRTNGLTWRLKVYPNGNGMAKGSFVSIFLELSAGFPGSSKYEYCVEMLHKSDDDETKIVSRTFASHFEIGECWGYNRFYRADTLQSGGFLARDGSLHLKFHVRPPSFPQLARDQARYIQHLQDANTDQRRNIVDLHSAMNTLLAERETKVSVGLDTSITSDTGNNTTCPDVDAGSVAVVARVDDLVSPGRSEHVEHKVTDTHGKESSPQASIDTKSDPTKVAIGGSAGQPICRDQKSLPDADHKSPPALPLADTKKSDINSHTNKTVPLSATPLQPSNAHSDPHSLSANIDTKTVSSTNSSPSTSTSTSQVNEEVPDQKAEKATDMLASLSAQEQNQALSLATINHRLSKLMAPLTLSRESSPRGSNRTSQLLARTHRTRAKRTLNLSMHDAVGDRDRADRGGGVNENKNSNGKLAAMTSSSSSTLESTSTAPPVPSRQSSAHRRGGYERSDGSSENRNVPRGRDGYRGQRHHRHSGMDPKEHKQSHTRNLARFQFALSSADLAESDSEPNEVANNNHDARGAVVPRATQGIVLGPDKHGDYGASHRTLSRQDNPEAHQYGGPLAAQFSRSAGLSSARSSAHEADDFKNEASQGHGVDSVRPHHTDEQQPSSESDGECSDMGARTQLWTERGVSPRFQASSALEDMDFPPLPSPIAAASPYSGSPSPPRQDLQKHRGPEVNLSALSLSDVDSPNQIGLNDSINLSDDLLYMSFDNQSQTEVW